MNKALVLAIINFFGPLFILAQNIAPGSDVKLKALSVLGVPLHATAGDRAVSGQAPDGGTVHIEEIDEATKWVRVSGENVDGWIIQKYIDTTAADSAIAVSSGSIVIGAWNLEHFDETKQRGFPENTQGGPSYPPRTAGDIQRIATVIQELKISILVLSEIDSDPSPEGTRSEELDVLVNALGNGYQYEIGESGGSQHLALLYDSQIVRLNSVCECSFSNEELQGKGLFDRQPLIGHFTLLANGSPQNDLAVVGVHLASGQHLTQNHDTAMDMLVDKLQESDDHEFCIPDDEHDIVIMGDFNANRFDNKQEEFWDQMEEHDWDVLANSDSSYPVTRLSGHPLGLRNSRIDYIIVSRGNQGLQGEEITVPEATVHTELIGDDAESYRREASDHLPVTVETRVIEDTDM